ncbi:MAG TPA: S8 family serine peptidase [Rhodoferax sp.]|nr:S8 family serine peptidase [Rhodoferax sp.]
MNQPCHRDRYALDPTKCMRLLACALLLWLTGAQYALATAERVVLGNSLAIPLAASTDPSVSNALDKLRKKMAQTTAMRVIVGVRVPFAPEGLLAAASSAQQRIDIAAGHRAVLGKIPALAEKTDKSRLFETIPFMALEVTPKELEELAALTEVTSIIEDRPASFLLAESVPLVGGTSAWASGYTGAGQVVAVLDTGVDKTHTFLTGKVVSEACYSTNATNVVSICPGGVTSSTSPNSALPYSSGVCPSGQCDHGTHVAGIAAGKSASFSGVAKEASVIAVQVFSRFNSSTDCGGSSPCVMSYSSDQISGLERVYALRNDYSIAAANMSLGGGSYSSQTDCDLDNYAIKASIDNLRAARIATVIASGNSSYTSSMGGPGCVSSAVSVGATWDSGAVNTVASYSNSVSFLNLLAPGSMINSSVPTPANSFSSWQGTSMATPHVAGAWAVLKHKASTATVNEVLAAFSSSGLAVTDSRNGITKPRINLPAALTALTPGVQFSLSVSKAGAGTGSVVSSPPGIDCGAGCVASFSSGTAVTLTATPSGSSIFTGWSDACAGTTCNLTMSTALSATATFVPGMIVTPINQANLSGSSGNSQYFSVVVPVGAANLVIQTSGGTGDADLYVKAGSQPTTAVYDCRPYLPGNAETCTFGSPLATTYHILLRAYSAYSGVTLTAKYTTAAPVYPGAFNITAASMTVRENAGNAVISVTRTEGSDGAASVAYSTSAGSATAGVDFSTASGTLIWGGGDASTRTFSVPIINNTVRNHTPRSFSASLSSASVARLGTVTSITVNILDDEVIAMPWLNLLLLDD